MRLARVWAVATAVWGFRLGIEHWRQELIQRDQRPNTWAQIRNYLGTWASKYVLIWCADLVGHVCSPAPTQEKGWILGKHS